MNCACKSRGFNWSSKLALAVIPMAVACAYARSRAQAKYVDLWHLPRSGIKFAHSKGWLIISKETARPAAQLSKQPCVWRQTDANMRVLEIQAPSATAVLDTIRLVQTPRSWVLEYYNTGRARVLKVNMALLVLGTGSFALPLFFNLWQVYSRQRRNECRNCGYSLQGLPENRCPECGTLFKPEPTVALDEG